MPEFLRLSIREQADILSAMAARIGCSAQILQKDIWVCWVLRELFGHQTGVRMAFKGGTSLSKVYQAIHRFSEDVDVTLDYRDLCPALAVDPFSENITESKKKRFSEQLRAKALDFVHQVIEPRLTDPFMELTNGTGRIEVSEDGEKVWLRYPPAAGFGSGYVEDCVLVEFGGRNVTEPNESHRITATIAQHLPSLEFPQADVVVLSPARTFWEKATLIHVECHRQRGFDPNRISRHWYDLVMLYGNEIGRIALSDRDLLANVVRHKKMFFNASYAHYDDCLTGHFRIIPDEPLLSGLKQDYQQMATAGMFDTPPPDFEEMMAQLKQIQEAING